MEIKYELLPVLLGLPLGHRLKILERVLQSPNVDYQLLLQEGIRTQLSRIPLTATASEFVSAGCMTHNTLSI